MPSKHHGKESRQTAGGCATRSSSRFKVTKGEAKEMKDKMQEIVALPHMKAVETLLLGKFDGEESKKCGWGRGLRPRLHHASHEVSWARAKDEDIIGVLPTGEHGTLYPDEPLQFCPNPSCKAKMMWYDISEIDNSNVGEVFLCSNAMCPYLPSNSETIIRPVKQQYMSQLVEAMDTSANNRATVAAIKQEPVEVVDASDEATVSAIKHEPVEVVDASDEATVSAMKHEPVEVVDASDETSVGIATDETEIPANNLEDVNEKALVIKDLLMANGGATEPDYDIVNKAMQEYYANGKKRKDIIAFEPDEFEPFTLEMIFDRDDLNMSSDDDGSDSV